MLQIVHVNSETVTDVTSTDFPYHYPGEDHAWDKEKFRKNLKVEFHYHDPLTTSFSLIGVDASVANAFRRILIADIPTLAIEYVFVHNNTSIIQDEVLASRLGLVPFKGDRKTIQEWMKWFKKLSDEEKESLKDNPYAKSYDYNTVVLELNIECTRNEDASPDERDPLVKYHNAHVYAKDIVFKPFGRQLEKFSGEGTIKPTHPDILIAKMRPGQCIDVEMHAIKGVGSDHAKFSPVATASYRLLPTITITEPILGDDALKFQKCFPQGVIGIEPFTKEDEKNIKNKLGKDYDGRYDNKIGEKKAVVEDAMKDTVSRECLRHDEFNKKVKLGRVRDHFIFQIESLGQWESDELFVESIKILRKKCQTLKGQLKNVV